MTTINGRACVANGRNLLLDTDFNNLDLWYGNHYWTKQPDKYNGLAVMQTTGDWNGLSQFVKVKTGEVYTFSIYARYTSGTGSSNFYWQLNDNPESGHDSAQVSDVSKQVNLSDNWQRVSMTTTITADGYIRARLERTNNNDNTLQIAGHKLETGRLATPLTPAPVDKVFSNGKQVYGRNLLTGTSGPFIMGYGIPNTTWDETNQVSGISLPVTAINAWTEVLPQGTGFSYTYMPGVTYTQSIYISTDAPLTGTPISFTWYTIGQYGHDTRGSDNLVKVSTNVYRATSTYTWPSSNSPADNSRNADLMNVTEVFDFTKGTFLKFYKPKLELGTTATPYSPAPEDVM